MTPNDRLLQLIRRIDPRDAQNRLMRIADRELSLSMLYMTDKNRVEVLSFIAVEKAKRVREELGFCEKLAVRYGQYRIAIDNVLRQLEEPGSSAPIRSYLRPRRTGRDLA